MRIVGTNLPEDAWFNPVAVATTGAGILLSGQQTIDGVVVGQFAAGDLRNLRILVKDQANAVQNGLYDTNTGAWTRCLDANDKTQWGQGVQVIVTGGTLNAGTAWQCTTAPVNGQIIPGTHALTFAPPSFGAAVATSLTTPVVYGGSAAGSALNLQSTSSGAPSGDKVTLTAGGAARETVLSNGNIGFGTETNPQFPFVFSMNTATGVNIAPAGVWKGFVFYSDDGDSGVGLNLLHVGAGGGITDARINGTLAAPTNVASADQVGNFVYSGWGAGALQGGRVRMTAFATENWTATFGCRWQLDATPTGGVRTQVINAQAGVNIGTSQVDPGAGSLQVQATILVSSTSTAGADAPILVNANTVNTPVAVPAGTLQHWVASDAGNGRHVTDVFGNASGMVWHARAFGGTAGTPSALGAGSTILSIVGQEYDGSAVGTAAAIDLVNINAASGTDHSGLVRFRTVPTGSTTLSQAAAIYRGMILGSGTTDPGLGNLTASGFHRAMDGTAIPAGGTQDAGYLFSSTAHFGTFFGSGAPTLSSAQGSLYLRSDGTEGTRLYVNNNGSTGWSTMAGTNFVGVARYVLTGVNFNSANTDSPVTIVLPTGVTRWKIQNVHISNASASISTATIGVFTGAGGTGQTIAANQAITVTASAADTLNNVMGLTLTNAATMAYNDTTIQVRIGTAQGSAATADVIVDIFPLS